MPAAATGFSVLHQHVLHGPSLHIRLGVVAHSGCAAQPLFGPPCAFGQVTEYVQVCVCVSTHVCVNVMGGNGAGRMMT